MGKSPCFWFSGAGIKLYPHLLRHLRATLYVKEGLHERIIMRLLGHKNREMIRRCVNLVHRDVEEAVLKHYGIGKIKMNYDKN